MSSGAVEETNQSWSVLACGHGTTEGRPPGLCSGMTGQSRRVQFVCVYVRAPLDQCFPVKVCLPACEHACMYQQECFSCQSKAQIIIWSAGSPVVVTAAIRSDAGAEEWRWTARWNSVVFHNDPSMKKTQATWREIPMNHCSFNHLADHSEVSGLSKYEWILSKTIKRDYRDNFWLLLLKCSNLYQCNWWEKTSPFSEMYTVGLYIYVGVHHWLK